MSHVPSVRDPARQPERTRLAWRRTVLGFTVVALFTVRLAIVGPVSPLRFLAIAGILAGWVVMLVASWQRIRVMAQPAPPPPRWSMPVITLVALWFVAIGGALTFMP